MEQREERAEREAVERKRVVETLRREKKDMEGSGTERDEGKKKARARELEPGCEEGATSSKEAGKEQYAAKTESQERSQEDNDKGHREGEANMSLSFNPSSSSPPPPPSLPSSLFLEGWSYRCGTHGKPNDKALAQLLIETAAASGSAVARGYCALHGWGRPKDEDEAFQGFCDELGTWRNHTTRGGGTGTGGGTRRERERETVTERPKARGAGGQGMGLNGGTEEGKAEMGYAPSVPSTSTLEEEQEQARKRGERRLTQCAISALTGLGRCYERGWGAEKDMVRAANKSL